MRFAWKLWRCRILEKFTDENSGHSSDDEGNRGDEWSKRKSPESADGVSTRTTVTEVGSDSDEYPGDDREWIRIWWSCDLKGRIKPGIESYTEWYREDEGISPDILLAFGKNGRDNPRDPHDTSESAGEQERGYPYEYTSKQGMYICWIHDYLQ